METVTKKSKGAAEHQFIKHVEVGDTFSGVYYVERIDIKLAKNGNRYSDFTLRDKSGSAFARYWGVSNEIESKTYVDMSANTEEYLDRPQIVIQRIDPEDSPENLENYILKSDSFDEDTESFDELIETVEALCEDSGNETPILIAREIFNKSKFFNKFVKSPSSGKSYYGREAGLLKQTANVAKMAEVIASNYSLESNEKAILLVSAMMHKIGSVDAYVFENLIPVETVRGALSGIKTLTTNRVFTAWKMLNRKQECDEGTFDRIMHCLSTCFDSYSSKPMTKEAIVLAEAYRADLTITESFDFIEGDESADENFTSYDSSKRRRYFKG